jgi:hypothetical protein
VFQLLDFVLNDGPNNKYALICKHCFGHNGLVQEQELGKLRYKCAICGQLNGPPLPPQQQQAMQAAAAGVIHAGGGGAPPTTPAHGHQQGGGNGGAAGGSIPLTPFPALPLNNNNNNNEEDEQKQQRRARSETDPHGGGQYAPQGQEGSSTGVAGAESPRRSSRVSSRSPAGRGRAASFAAAVAAGATAAQGEEADVAAPVGPAASDSDGAEEVEGEDEAFVKVANSGRMKQGPHAREDNSSGTSKKHARRNELFHNAKQHPRSHASY